MEAEVKEAEVSEEIAKSEKMEGIKAEAANQEAIDQAKNAKAEETVAEALPQFFIDPSQRFKVEIDVIYDKKTGRLLSITQKTDQDLDLAKVPTIGMTHEWFEFSIPTYDDMATYRQRCSSYNSSAGKLLINGVQMRNFLLVWHLKDWSIRNAKGEKIQLTHDAAGSLSDVAIAEVYKIYPAMLDVVMTLFERNGLLS